VDLAGPFSFAAMLESRAAFKTRMKPKLLSRQQIVDCVTPGNCVSGNPIYALQYALSNKIYLKSDYRAYDSTKSKKCEVSTIKKNTQPANLSFVKDFKVHKKVNSAELKYLLLKGPVPVQLDAKQFEFVFYKGGVLKYECNEPNHSVLLVGYMNPNEKRSKKSQVKKEVAGNKKKKKGKKAGKKAVKKAGKKVKQRFRYSTKKGYWIVRNSWGKDWGYNGNILLEMNDNWDACGMYSDIIELS